MSLLEAFILGLLQGLTEFLPVSSSGHIELGKAAMGVEIKDNLQFTLVVHIATVLSTFVVFRKEILNIFTGLLQFKLNIETLYALKILIAMLPVTFIGMFFLEDVEALFDGNIRFVGIMLWVTGILLLLTTVIKTGEKEISFLTAFLVGIAQALAVLPGLSRSGSTISTGLMLGIPKDQMARFSFFIVIPPILGKLLLDTIEIAGGSMETPTDLMPLTVGFLTAFFTGLFACKWMIDIVKRQKVQYFAIYCFVIGTIAIGLTCF